MHRIISFIVFIISACVLHAQTTVEPAKFRLGINAMGTVSKINAEEPFSNNFTRRNVLGAGGGITGQYDLFRKLSLTLGVNFISKGYKINNDTLGSSSSIVLRTSSLNIPLGFIYRSKFNSSNYVQVKFGGSLNFDLNEDSITQFNATSNAKFRVTQIRENKNYPILFLGVGLGGNTDKGDRYEFGLTYYHSLNIDSKVRVETGNNYASPNNFKVNYRGGFLAVGLSYYFNLSNFKRSTEYFE